MMQRSRPRSRGCWAGFRTKFLTCPSRTSTRTGRMAKRWGLWLTAVLQVSFALMVSVLLLSLLVPDLLLMKEGDFQRGAGGCWATARLLRKLESEEASCWAAHCRRPSQEKYWPRAECTTALLEVPPLSFVLGAWDEGTNAGSQMAEGSHSKCQQPFNFRAWCVLLK